MDCKGTNLQVRVEVGIFIYLYQTETFCIFNFLHDLGTWRRNAREISIFIFLNHLIFY